jgi:hypothetical protein
MNVKDLVIVSLYKKCAKKLDAANICIASRE